MKKKRVYIPQIFQPSSSTNRDILNIFTILGGPTIGWGQRVEKIYIQPFGLAIKALLFILFILLMRIKI